VAAELRNMGLPWPNTTALFPITARLEKAAASYTTHSLPFFFGFMGFMGGAEAWAWSLSSISWCALQQEHPQLHDLGAIADIPQHLIQPTPHNLESHIPIDLTRVGRDSS
jgi:hypothetical protein